MKTKRRRIIRKRKKRGKKLMPRATLFKPPKKEKLEKNPLWREVYMREDSDGDDGSESEQDDAEVFQMLKDTFLAKGVASEKKIGKKMTQTAEKKEKMNRSTADRLRTPTGGKR